MQSIVIGPVTRDLMPRIGHALHQIRLAPGDITQNKERRLVLVFVEHLQQQIHVLLNPRRPFAPFFTFDRAIGSFDVKVFFDIDRHAAKRFRIGCV